MLNILDYHKTAGDERKYSFRSPISKLFYYMIGAGGTGGYAVQRISKMMSAFSSTESFLLIADPDTVEERNLLRQPFILQDIGLKKADVLAKRYGATYGLKIGSFSESYIESVESLERLFSLTDFRHADGQFIQKVLIGAVDNDFTRHIMNEYFNKTDDLIYIDAGIEGVFIPTGDRPSHEWTPDEVMDNIESGYSGQVVVGVKKKGQVILPALDSIYPVNAKDAIPPSHNCGVEPYQPQRMISNEMAAFQISTVVNELFSSNSILIHYTNFNARTGSCRPVYADEVSIPATSTTGNVTAIPVDELDEEPDSEDRLLEEAAIDYEEAEKNREQVMER